jgi:lipoprotein-releasing system permease protein
MLCIGLSIIPMVVVTSISNGMINAMTERIIGLSSSHLEAFVAAGISQTSSPENFKKYAQGLLESEDIKNVFPEVNISALAAGKKIRTGIEIRAVESDIFETNQSFKKLFTFIEGDTSSFTSGSTTALIGQKMAEELELKKGDTFRVITTRSLENKIIPRLTSFTVGAVISSGYQELDQFWVFIPLESAYSKLSLDDASYNILIETKDAFSPDLVRLQKKTASYFGRYANVYRWDQIHSAEFENFSSTKVMLVFVMMMIVLVASVNISSAIIMLVMERQKEIAILKSIGASPAGISFSFLLAGMSCAAGGIIFGLPLGIILTILSNQIINGLEKVINLFTRLFHGQKIVLMDPAYYLSEISVEIPVKQVILIVIGVLLLSLLVSYLPARKAGKEKPLEILRKN